MTNTIQTDELDTFTRAYLECALWCSYYQVGGDEHYLGDDFGPEAFDQNTIEMMIKDCALFQAQHAELLQSAYDSELAYDYYTEDNAGHDFFLTRNGHGAGFWDRRLGTIGEELSEAAHKFGEFSLYLHNGEILAN